MQTGDFQGAADADRRAVEVLGNALADSGRPLVIASGTAGLAPGRRACRSMCVFLPAVALIVRSVRGWT
jgi:hypothetical protein